MKEAGLGGSIINISSIGGEFIGNSREHPNPPYFTAKAAVHHFTRYLAVELGDYGITVNCVAPGMTHSDLDKDLPQSALPGIMPPEEQEIATDRFKGAQAVAVAGRRMPLEQQQKKRQYIDAEQDPDRQLSRSLHAAHRLSRRTSASSAWTSMVW